MGLYTGSTNLEAYNNTSITDNAVDIFVYDTSKDSDGGAWRKRCQHTSWYNEASSSTRGSRKEFPAVAVIVAESGKVTIYDGDTPDLDMWMVFNTGSYTILLAPCTLTSTIAMNGVLVVGDNGSAAGTYVISFIDEVATRYGSSGHYPFLKNISERNETSGTPYGSLTGAPIVNWYVNDVAMTVLPNAPIDSATGLPTPTIAVATDGGVSVIKDDGTVVDLTDSGSYDHSFHVSFNDSNELVYTYDFSGAAGGRYTRVIPIPSSDFISSGLNDLTGCRVYSSAGYNQPKLSPITASYTTPISLALSYNKLAFGFQNGYQTKWRGLSLVEETPSNQSKGSVAYITSDYNTGYMTGDIRGAWLSDTDATDVTGSNLCASTDFSAGWSLNPSGANFSISGGVLQVSDTSSTDSFIDQNITCVVGKTYVIDIVASGVGTGLGLYVENSSSGTSYGWSKTYTFTATVTSNLVRLYRYGGHSGNGGTVSSFTVRLADPDRSVKGKGLQVFGTVDKDAVATGAELVGYSGFSSSNYLEQPYNSDLDFGTGDFSIMGWLLSSNTSDREYILERDSSGGTATSIAVVREYTGKFQLHVGGDVIDTSSASYSNGNYHFAMIRRSGVGYIYINGVLDGSGSMADSVTDTDATTTVGIDWAKSASGWYSRDPIALLRISATAPSAEQIKDIYEAEKPLFQENAKCTLNGSSDAVTAMDYDDSNDELLVGTSGGLSVFKGLRRVDENTNNISEVAQQGGLRVEEY